MTKKIFIVITLSFLVLIGVFFYKTQITKGADFTGYYISHELGRDNVLGFEYFQPNNITLPSGTSITYQFASKTDNYASWTNAESTNSKIDLTKFDSIKNSNYIKVRINFSSNSTEKPSLQGYTLLMRVPDGTAEIISSIKPAEGQTDPIPLAKGVTEIKQNITKTSLSQLIATGGALWFNILIALMIGAVIAFLIIKYSKQIMAMRTKIMSIIIIAALLLVSATFIWLVKSKKIGIFASENYQASVMIISGELTFSQGEFHNVIISPIDFSIFLNTNSGLPQNDELAQKPTNTSTSTPIKINTPIASSTPSLTATITPTPTATQTNVAANSTTATPTPITNNQTSTVQPAEITSSPTPETPTPTETLTPISFSTPVDIPTIGPTQTVSISPNPPIEISSIAETSCSTPVPQTKDINTELSCSVDWGSSIADTIELQSLTTKVNFNLLVKITPQNARWEDTRIAGLFLDNRNYISQTESFYPKCMHSDTMFRYDTSVDYQDGFNLGNGEHTLRITARLKNQFGDINYVNCNPEKKFTIKKPNDILTNLNLQDATIREDRLFNLVELPRDYYLNNELMYTISNEYNNFMNMNYDDYSKYLQPFSLEPGKYSLVLENWTNHPNTKTNKFNLSVDEYQKPMCNSDNSQCSLGRINVEFNKYKDYSQFYAKVADYYAPAIYKELHENKKIEDDPLFNKIEFKEIIDPDVSTWAAGLAVFITPWSNNYSQNWRSLSPGVYITDAGFWFNISSDNLGKFFYSINTGRGLALHELGHYLKYSKVNVPFINSTIWIEEATANYIKYKFGDQRADDHPSCTNKTYLDGADCGADFFLFIENKYDKPVIKKYVSLLETTETQMNDIYKMLFTDYIGKDINTLWEEYKQAHQ